MSIYEDYAETLLKMHQYYHDLVLLDFPVNSTFKKHIYENRVGFKWDGILFNSKKDKGIKNHFPLCPIYNSSTYGLFSIEYRSYNGLIGKKAVSKVLKQANDENGKSILKFPNGDFRAGKHGLFDLYVNTGNRYLKLFGGDATHFNLFQDLLKNSNYDSCFKVWQGEEIIELIAKNDDEYESLLTLSLLMFEQEVNYGEEVFQQFTNFSIKEGFRPRDMIMGFVSMMFKDVNLFNEYPFWTTNKNNYKISPNFGFGSNEKYQNLESKYKDCFEEFRNNNIDVKPLLANKKLKERFWYYARKSNQNPALLSLELPL